MDVQLDIAMRDRDGDRVQCAVTVTPTAGPSRVDGVAVQLVDAEDGPLGARALLPVVGRLDGPVTLHVELRADRTLPVDARLVAAAWHGRDGVRLSVPAQPPPTLLDFVRGRRAPTGVDLSPVLPIEGDAEARLRALAPWVSAPLRAEGVAAVLEGRESNPSADDLAETFDLHEDEASWLRDLLAEDD